MEKFKQDIKNRIKHCEERIKQCEEEYKGKEDTFTFYAGQTYGYWKGLLEGYNNQLDMLNDNNFYTENDMSTLSYMTWHNSHSFKNGYEYQLWINSYLTKTK